MDIGQAERITAIVSNGKPCPICGQPISLNYQQERITAYGRQVGISYRMVVMNPEAYRGRIQLCHYDCWYSLPEDERQRLNK